jgi:hypothetical protein
MRSHVSAVIVLALCAGGVLAADWARVSPFTKVDIAADTVRVEYDGKMYDLVSIDGLTTEQMLGFCRKTYRDRGEDRFADDLVEVMDAMGKRPADSVKLVLRDAETKQELTIDRAPLTKENRQKVFRTRHAAAIAQAQAAAPAPAAMPPSAMTAGQMTRALDDFQAALEQRWAYLAPSNFDHASMIKAIRERIAKGMTGDQFVLELQKVIARGIDGHAGVVGVERSVQTGFLPFLVEPVGERFVAFDADRTKFLSDGFPYIESIDDRKLSDWLEAAAPFVAKGSPQYLRREELRWLRCIAFLREQLGAKKDAKLTVGLASADGTQHKTVTLDLAQRSPVYGVWPREDYKPRLPAGVSFIRIAEMNDDAAKLLDSALTASVNAKGLIIDVRDNGGGSRDALRTLAARLMKPNDAPRVVNVAVARGAKPDAEKMASRFLYPESSPRWTDAERAAVAKIKETFHPEWPPPRELYSDYHYMVLSPGDGKSAFTRPIVILMNSKCFSATDIFLMSTKGMPNVTLLGAPSGGGSSNPTTIKLADSPITVRLGTMISFQHDGRLLDTHGVEPDVAVDPVPEFFTGGRDNQIEQAAALILKHSD